MNCASWILYENNILSLIKVGRALSLSKTPSKLKRTVSQMMSPFGSRNCQPDADAISQCGSESTAAASVTPLRANLSTMSLWVRVTNIDTQVEFNVRNQVTLCTYFYTLVGSLVPSEEQWTEGTHPNRGRLQVTKTPKKYFPWFKNLKSCW